MLKDTSNLGVWYASSKHPIRASFEEIGIVPIVVDDIFQELLLLMKSETTRQLIAHNIIDKIRIPRYLRSGVAYVLSCDSEQMLIRKGIINGRLSFSVL